MKRKSILGRTVEAAHRNLLALVVAAYVLAAFAPAAGVAVRRAELAVGPGGCRAVVPAPAALLAGLLFVAGLGVDAAALARVARRPVRVLAGLGANVLVPVGFLAALAAALQAWHDPDEGRCLLLGLGVVAAMPVAGSSAAWSQTAGGCAALSLGLVVLSTLLSPLVTPLTLAVVGPLAGGGDVAAPGGAEVAVLLAAGVAVPSAVGMAVRAAAGRARVERSRPLLRLATASILLVLCYANAAAALPAVAADPDWDYLALTVAAAGGLCGTTFAAGWGVARALGADPGQTRSLVFALGMSNNGTGLVVAGTALAGVPAAAVPVLAYNLIQHVFAAATSRALGRASGE